MKKKVLHIVESFASGVFSFLVDLVNNTIDEYEIIIAYGVRKETSVNFKEYFPDTVRFIEIRNFTRRISIEKDIKAFWEIKKIIKEVKPDIVHLHSSKAGFIGRFANNGKKVKLLYNPHGFSFLMKNTSKYKRLIYWLLEKFASYRNCTIIGCSEGEYQEAIKLTKNAICINNGIDIDALKIITQKYEKKPIDFKNLKICTSGRIGYQKNPTFFNKIAESMPEHDFTWIGDGELRNELISSNIKITGWKNREEVLRIVNENDIFVLTSLWEGLPISLLEAMYLKKVCLVTNVIGNKNVIKDNINGLIIDEDNYINKICSLNPQNTNELTSNALNDINKIYNVKTMVKEYKGVYAE